MKKILRKGINYLLIIFMVAGLLSNWSSTVFAASNTISDGWYYIKNVNAQKYLQVKDSKGKNAQNVEISKGTGAGTLRSERRTSCWFKAWWKPAPGPAPTFTPPACVREASGRP